MKNNLAPIAFFCYNRPEHTRQTLVALKENLLANESVLHVFVDGPKTNAKSEDKKNHDEVLKVVKSDQWCNEVVFHIAENNKGCKDSIISGIDEVINQYGKVIVIEDDIVTSKYFLSFMNKALVFYEEKKTVFSIAGHRLPERKFSVPADYKYDVFAFPRVFIWGWATWADRWKTIDWEMKSVPELLNNNNISEAFSRGGDELLIYLKEQYEIGVDNWDIQVALSSFVNHYVSIVPCKSYVNNIGLDGSGVHCGNLSHNLDHNLEECVPDPILPDIIYEDKRIVNALCSAFSTKRRPLPKKILNRISRILTGKNIYVLKKKVFAS